MEAVGQPHLVIRNHGKRLPAQKGEVFALGDVDLEVREADLVTINVDLEETVAVRRFREDPFYRLNAAALRLPPPRERLGDVPRLAQQHLRGLVYSIADKNAPPRHTQQYFTIFGNRAICNGGWEASAAHRPNGIDLFTYADEPRATSRNPENEVKRGRERSDT